MVEHKQLIVGIAAIKMNQHLKGLSPDEVLDAIRLVIGDYCTYCGVESKINSNGYTGCSCMKDD